MSYPKTFICQNCGKEIANKNRSKTPKYCSRRCQADFAIEKAQIVRVCLFCGKEFKKPRGQLSYKNALTYCSRKCHGLSKRGENNPMYKNGTYINKKGYVYVTINRKSFRRCRLAVEQNIGRKLMRCEEVHHKNGIKDDDRIENLEIWNHSHPSGQRAEDKIKWAIEFLEIYGYKVSGAHT